MWGWTAPAVLCRQGVLQSLSKPSASFLVPNDNHYMPPTTSLQATSLLHPSPKWVMLGPTSFLPWPCHTLPSMSPHGPLGTQPVLIKSCAPSPAFWLHPAPISALQPAGLLKDICHSLGAVQKPFRIPSGSPCKTQTPDANSRPVLHHPPRASTAQTPMRLPRPLRCSDFHVEPWLLFSVPVQVFKILPTPFLAQLQVSPHHENLLPVCPRWWVPLSQSLGFVLDYSVYLKFSWCIVDLQRCCLLFWLGQLADSMYCTLHIYTACSFVLSWILTTCLKVDLPLSLDTRGNWG